MNAQAGMINRRALLFAAGVGTGLALLTFLVAALPIAFTGANAASSVPLICSSCFSVLTFLLTGAVYTYFVRRGGGPTEMGKMALGGALSALIAAILFSACRACLLVATASDFEVMGLLGNRTDINADNTTSVLLLSGAVLCGTVFAYAVLGAAGGALGSLIRPSTPPGQPAASGTPQV